MGIDYTLILFTLIIAISMILIVYIITISNKNNIKFNSRIYKRLDENLETEIAINIETSENKE